MHFGSCRRSRQNESQRVFAEIMAEKHFKFDDRNESTNPRNAMNSKQDKLKDSHTEIHL